MIDDLKKRLKETAERIANSQAAQNITTQTPKTRTTKNTTSINKSGATRNATIKEPKRELVSWTDDDPLKNWDHRAFLEGFYEVDGTTNDWERERRMSLVDEALKEIKERDRKANKYPGVILSGGQSPKSNSNEVRAPFRRELIGQKGTSQ